MGETSLDRVVLEYQRPDLFIAGDEEASPWVPFGDDAFIRHLAFDVRNNSFTNVLWVKAGGRLGRHRHRGPVSGYVLEGSSCATTRTG
jgi:quercetin dioxygenase-like cupin family protein